LDSLHDLSLRATHGSETSALTGGVSDCQPGVEAHAEVHNCENKEQEDREDEHELDHPLATLPLAVLVLNKFEQLRILS